MNNIPFDNLYKFMAISGLATFLLIVGYWYESGKEGVIEYITAGAVVKEIGVEIEYLSQYLEYYRKYEKDEAKAKKYFLDKNKEIDLRNIKRKESQSIRDYYDSLEGVHNIVFGIGSLGAFLLSFFGFLLWYFRLQKYKDELVKTESTDKALKQERANSRGLARR